ncbi:MAG: hypothetical protein OSJ53_06830 [Kineothrix sp.]|jgi:hypothetical protein|nr:hypothetical protein [Lachnospiraceae bacterium]MCX4343582.1 hypothetical protein [Kineothrix sp.]
MTDSEKLDLLLEKVSAMETKMDTMETKMDIMETNVKNVKADVKDIKLILENEIRVNIQRVAEGHLDLSRNLHEAMRPSNEVEMLAIKVRMLETDVKELKAKLA